MGECRSSITSATTSTTATKLSDQSQWVDQLIDDNFEPSSQPLIYYIRHDSHIITLYYLYRFLGQEWGQVCFQFQTIYEASHECTTFTHPYSSPMPWSYFPTIPLLLVIALSSPSTWYLTLCVHYPRSKEDFCYARRLLIFHLP
ncbi:hypothetical protein ABW19_dt0200074 [Dactylella cylindrospora]|nr:hypothetical protein ABW19_dt0200074 [Dactylella cylindrospora]